MKTLYICMAAAMMLSGCVLKTETPGDLQQSQYSPRDIKLGDNTIDIQHVTSEGKLRSVNIVPIYSVVDGVIHDFSLEDGMAVKKGQQLMRIDDSGLLMQIAELEAELKRIEFEVENSFIGLGYKRNEFDQIPEEQRNNVEIMTGYQATKLKLEHMRQQLDYYVIKAPFNGNIIKVRMTHMGYARQGDTMFYLLDSENLKVEFMVVEKLLPQFRLGMELEFTTISYHNSTYKAKLISIAPDVSDDGMIRMTAKVEGTHPELLSGMTVLVNMQAQ